MKHTAENFSAPATAPDGTFYKIFFYLLFQENERKKKLPQCQQHQRHFLLKVIFLFCRHKERKQKVVKTHTLFNLGAITIEN